MKSDVQIRSMQIAVCRYANKFKCDILQISLRTLYDNYCVDFYKYIDPQIALTPIPKRAAATERVVPLTNAFFHKRIFCLIHVTLLFLRIFCRVLDFYLNK